MKTFIGHSGFAICLTTAALLLSAADALKLDRPLSSARGTSIAARTITFDLGAGHPFLGLGTVIWPGAPFAAQRHDVMVATRMNWVRIPLITTFRDTDEQPGMGVAQLLAQRNGHPLRAATDRMTLSQVTG